MAPQDVRIWSAFETAVAEFYRSLGALKVQQNVNLAGNEVDVYVEERTASGQVVRTAVECKYYQRKVPKDVVLRFATVAKFLRDAGLVDKAVLVSYQGFTPDSFSVAQASGVELRAFADFEAKVSYYIHGAVATIIEAAERKPVPASFPDLVFVLMPFKDELDDLYFYGIRGSAERVGLRCKRADELIHDAEIMQEVIDHIKRARVIVAEVSDHNPNVFYEVGWAHALERPTILVARDGVSLPFDIAHINTVFYKSIKDLDDKLSERFRGLGSNEQE
jgi:hypothetical protein